MKRLTSLVSVGAVLAMVVCAGPAAAAGSNGGALNMLKDPTMGTVPMVNDENNPTASSSAYGSYGNAGMFCAVFVSNGITTPGGCNAHQ
jgi:hypothetical protein